MFLAHNLTAHWSPGGEGKQQSFMFWLHSLHLKSSKSCKADKCVNPVVVLLFCRGRLNELLESERKGKGSICRASHHKRRVK